MELSNPKQTKKAIAAFRGSIEAINLQSVSRGMRNMFVVYVHKMHDFGFRLDFGEFIQDMVILFDLLDELQDIENSETIEPSNSNNLKDNDDTK